MRLTDLLGDETDAVYDPGLAERTEIAGLTADSRDVLPGFLFAALPGATRDGRAFIADALGRGAAAILTLDRDKALPSGIAAVVAGDPRAVFAHMAARFYPERPDVVTAVTGTNGKSSVVHFAAQIWHALGYRAASLGTVGLHVPGTDRYDGGAAQGLTTPDPVALHRTLSRLAADGVTRLAIEASSHGLDQRRLDGVRLAAAGFTNLSRDHLDYHPDMESYFRAKARLFDTLLPAGGVAVLNADSPVFPRLSEIARGRSQPVLSYGRQGHDLTLLDVTANGEKLHLRFRHHHGEAEVALDLIGAFQAWNVLCALGLVVASGHDIRDAAPLLERLSGPRGRMERVAAKRRAAIYVDYAHTPDALDTVLGAIRPHTRNRLVVVFGAGGDRDPGKRAMMGDIASRRADIVYVTDDNPRNEDPAKIRAAIVAACPGAIEIGDRRAAIRAAVDGLDDGDILVIAGKGHEQGQIVKGQVFPFNDAAIARDAAGASR